MLPFQEPLSSDMHQPTTEPLLKSLRTNTHHPTTKPPLELLPTDTNHPTIESPLESLPIDTHQPIPEPLEEVEDSESDKSFEEVEDSESDNSSVSLVDEGGSLEEEDSDVNRQNWCAPDGDEKISNVYSDEDNGMARMAHYCSKHQWAPNPDGSISLKEGDIFGSAKLVRDIITRYAIQEGFELKKIKNDRIRFTAGCRNESCDLSYHAQQIGFVSGCRPFIGVDGCHLSGQFGGVMLSKVALDGHNSIFPLAFCVCESETLESWRWFLRLLKECLGWDDNRKICFMSDRQKGILSALEKEWPEADNRYCFRHMLSNFKGNKSNSLNGKFWRTVRVGSASEFKAAILSIKEESVDAYEWLMEEPTHKWARHAFDYGIKSDHVTNNMSESFNSWILEERDKPILTLCEHLRRKIMVRFCEKWDEIQKMKENITFYARGVVKTNEKVGRELHVLHGRGQWHETFDNGGKIVLVNIQERICNCGLWQISGLPCKHACAVLIYERLPSLAYVDWYYSKDAMEKTYGGHM